MPRPSERRGGATGDHRRVGENLTGSHHTSLFFSFLLCFLRKRARRHASPNRHTPSACAERARPFCSKHSNLAYPTFSNAPRGGTTQRPSAVGGFYAGPARNEGREDIPRCTSRGAAQAQARGREHVPCACGCIPTSALANRTISAKLSHLQR